MQTLLVSAIVTCAACYPVLLLLRRAGQLDLPNARSSHDLPTARGGGWAPLVGLLAGGAFAVVQDVAVPWWAVGAAIALACIGALDDRQGLPPLVRLACQAGMGAVVGFLAYGWLGAAVGLVLFAVTVNVVNFMDGINGITALTMLAWGFTAIFVAQQAHLGALAFLGAVTAGGALGFLPWNAPVARLFLGDVGSYLFGALVAGGVMVGWVGGASVEILLAPMAIYIGDTAWTLLARARRHEPLLTAHRSHVYQRLTGSSGRMSHLTVAACTVGLLTAITICWSQLAPVPAAALTALAVGAYLLSPRLLEGSGGWRR